MRFKYIEVYYDNNIILPSRELHFMSRCMSNIRVLTPNKAPTHPRLYIFIQFTNVIKLLKCLGIDPPVITCDINKLQN